MSELLTFLVSAVAISLSGVMAPGPITAATMASGIRNRHGGAMVAIGHGIIEFPLMAAIMFGAGAIFQASAARIAIGLIGGAFLLWMGATMLIAMRKPITTHRTTEGRHPITTGIILTVANPYFLLWWATIGLALATQAIELGVFAFIAFAIVHWLCDLVWMELLSLLSHGGSKLLGKHTDRIITLICGTALLLFGAQFIGDSAGQWWFGG